MTGLKTTALAATLLVGALAATSASATQFLFSYASNDLTQTASGTLDATLVAPGDYDVTSGTITAVGPLATGVGALITNPAVTAQSTSASGRFDYDDQLFPDSNPVILNGGLLFSIGGSEVNIFSNGPEPGADSFYNEAYANTSGTFSLGRSSVPEPATWATMLAGMGMAGASLRSRRRAVAAAA